MQYMDRSEIIHIIERVFRCADKRRQGYIECPRCKGVGEINWFSADRQSCPQCEGDGLVPPDQE